MKIRLQTLQHQTKAIRALLHVFEGAALQKPERPESNPLFDPCDARILSNILEIQQGKVEDVPAIARPLLKSRDNEYLGLDIRMETGTGKTYVYTRAMYELYRYYGFHKFILLVPSTPIKEGARNFIESSYAREHFADLFGSGLRLNLEVLDPQKKTKGRKMFPYAVSAFASSSWMHRGRLECLLMTDGMLLSKATMQTNYDQTILGTTSVPYDALAATRPIVIIDEPHRFRRENKAWLTMLEKLKPQAVIRFGATFPREGKSGEIDYDHLIYNLGSVDAFNNQLVKGVAVQYPKGTKADQVRLKLMRISVKKPKFATFRNEANKKTYELVPGDSLGELDGAFRGLNIDGIGKTENTAVKSGVTLSNGQILAVGDILSSDVYSETYQGVMMQQALENHFDAEWENFRRTRKVKTLTLFFIDSIESYRGDDGHNGHLRLRFQELLKAQLEKQIERFASSTDLGKIAYTDYLKASLSDLEATNGGYFSQDNATSDEAIRQEVDEILRDKETLLSFHKPDGSWNTMRFIFSKWTLREGWDNPNVFQIVKLRSSGSEISKLQEVGRGLRLPVDEQGNRLSDEQFYLTYLIDHTESDFARKLIGEINEDAKSDTRSIKLLLAKVSEKYGRSETSLFAELLQAGFVDVDQNIVEGKAEELYARYPEFNSGLQGDKVVEKPRQVHIRREKYALLKDLWEKLNQKYFLILDELNEEEIASCVDAILSMDDDIYQVNTQDVISQKIVNDDGTLVVRDSIAAYHVIHDEMPYGEWLKAAWRQTFLPIQDIHQGLIRRNAKAKLPEDFFNKTTLSRFVHKFQTWMQDQFRQRYSFASLGRVKSGTALTDEDGNPLEGVIQGNIGIYRADEQDVPEKFLYDAFVYDSPLERTNIAKSTGKEVVVFAKIPRRSIRVPLYFGGTTSPDFMYVLKDEDETVSVNFVVETKDVAGENDLRGTETLKIQAAQKFFESIQMDGVKVHFAPQLKADDINAMLKKALKSE
ncbi:MAG: type III restriction-modification system endonuclease [Peptoniphilaceae bacterium]|nr:type III restriction-modification system endonuclease [Peptoniphilaceae bacterium]